ncbi:MAG: hypothetical protein IQL11_10410 [Bacteroidales bacterium]|nr:hypothetical protein [Bacteroidales bacterium]
MKKSIDILVVRKEEDGTLARRRENYALKRDLQAQENNEAISRRLISEETVKDKSEESDKSFEQTIPPETS